MDNETLGVGKRKGELVLVTHSVHSTRNLLDAAIQHISSVSSLRHRPPGLFSKIRVSVCMAENRPWTVNFNGKCINGSRTKKRLKMAGLVVVAADLKTCTDGETQNGVQPTTTPNDDILSTSTTTTSRFLAVFAVGVFVQSCGKCGKASTVLAGTAR